MHGHARRLAADAGRVALTPSLLLLALLCAARPAATAAFWARVGDAAPFAAIVAADLDFDAGGAPLLAVGHDGGGSGTVTAFLALDNATGAWATFASHTPGMAQSYSHFGFRFRLGALYLGLRIDGEDISSVLRSGNSGSDGKFEGCWAFDGFEFDFEIDDLAGAGPASGDMRLLTSPDNVTLGLTTYNHTGWDQYPASDAFGPLTMLPSFGGGKVDAVQLVRGGSGGGGGAPPDLLLGAVAAQGEVIVWRTTLSNSTGFALAGGPFKGAEASLAHNFGVACVTFFEVAGAQRVLCSEDSDDAQPGVWTDLGLAHAQADATLVPVVAISASGEVFAAARSGNLGQLLVARCQLTKPLVAGCTWRADDIAAAQAVSDFDVKVSRGGAGSVFAVLSEGLPGKSGDAVEVFVAS